MSGVMSLMVAALVVGCFTAGICFAQKTASPAAVELSRELHEALNLAQHGQPRQAYEKVNAMLATHPNYAPALKLKGMLLESAGKGDEANESYAQALKMDPNDEDLLYKVGVYQLIKGDRAEAILLLTHYLKLEPKDGDGYFYLAQAYHLAGQNDAALKAIKECMQLKPDDAHVWQKYGELLASSGDGAAGLTWLEKAEKADPTLDRIDYDLGVANLSAMNLEDAEKFAQSAVQQHAMDAEALALLAAVEEKLAEWAEAKATYEKLLAINSGDETAQLGIGHCEYELKNYQASIDLLKELLQKDPTVALAHYYLSRDYLALGDATQAQYEADVHHKLMEATSFEPQAVGTELDRATWKQAKDLMDAKKEDAAVALIHERVKATGGSAGHAYFLVGTLYLYLGQTEKGIQNLKKAIEIEPKVRGAHTYLGIYELQQGKLDLAEKEFKTELGNDPNYLNALAELGSVRYKQQKWSEAVEMLSKSHTRTPTLLLELCDAQFRTGDAKNAKLTAETIVAYAKGDQQVLDELSALLRANHEDGLADRVGGTKK
jgi:tetratricopeptide (TPR) repeat protein